uniref:NADH-ubiquinone oxidoreductase chain 2 n=1 Tax=Cordylochernes scorpioides TaxID=51811 RepID=H9MFK4_9ARAC|nr:NADH dehydrogenase subunit 2 [Cordylochernes scorpioides]AEX55769.1 NADH dehydrogenase subunit 2 [Cordylochernes scorpioides]AEX55770.1 NADH dehydrogenase subunit 2 [Cordylochernes scorpioides]AEX55771.1 NADH dehydrogenase subunit 2 [Cordylochernes scorpioides]AEX55772.1 NADH dehydrogenase subunit 2 [Cordylochernes scorpioides]
MKILSKNNFSNSMFFLAMLILSGVIIVLVSKYWLVMWLGLELNLLGFILILEKSNEEFFKIMKYFIIQSVASIVISMSFFLKNCVEGGLMFSLSMAMIFALFLKLAVAPFHFWIVSLVKKMKSMNLFLILGLQKLAPMFIFSKISIFFKTNSMFWGMSALLGSILGLFSGSMNMILLFSSISHSPWMMMLMLSNSPNFWFIYFLVYLLNLSMVLFFSQENKYKLLMFLSLLSMGGLPPLLGFYVKWVAIFCNFASLTIILLLLSSIMNMYMYIRISIKSLLNLKNMNKKIMESKSFLPMFFFSPIMFFL